MVAAVSKTESETNVLGKLSEGEKDIDDALLSRIKTAYRHSMTKGEGDLSPLWSMIYAKNSEVHDALLNGSGLPELLNDPSSNYLFYGFDNMFRDFTEQIRSQEAMQTALCNFFFSELTTLAEATGVKRVWNPEGGAKFPHKDKPLIPALDDLLSSIEDRIGLDLKFPNPFPNEFGIASSRGIISQRTIHAVYQAWRIKVLTSQYGPRVAEIGAGLGRTAYFARALGIDDYTIIDLPMSNVAQANFLGRTVGWQNIALSGEQQSAGQIRILTSDWLKENDERFDVIANVDSLTEMDASVSASYASMAMERAKILWSINHEANTETVSTIEALRGRSIGRHPYWLRPGYIEEIFVGIAEWSRSI